MSTELKMEHEPFLSGLFSKVFFEKKSVEVALRSLAYYLTLSVLPMV